MKANPRRNWKLDMFGAGDNERHSPPPFRATVEMAPDRADREECQVEWEVLRIELVADHRANAAKQKGPRK